MADHDFGCFGDGIEGYVQYKQTFDRTTSASSGKAGGDKAGRSAPAKGRKSVQEDPLTQALGLFSRALLFFLAAIAMIVLSRIFS